MQYRQDKQTLNLSGEISVKTLGKAEYQGFIQAVKLPAIEVLDLAGVSRADSACVALLLAAYKQKPQIQWQNVPDSVQSLAELYEMGEWICALSNSQSSSV